MSVDVIQEFSHALAAHVDAGEALIAQLRKEKRARHGSPAFTYVAERGDVREEHMLHAHQDILISTLSGLDHLRGFCSTLQSHQIGAWSLGSLARGSSEAFGKVAYILEAPTPIDLYSRFSRLGIRSVSYLAGEEYREYEADWGRNAQEVVRAWEADLIAAGGEPISKTNNPTPPQLAKRLLRKTLEERASSWYASVAALSHTEFSAMDRLLDSSIHPSHAMIVITNGLYVNIEQLIAAPLLAQTITIREISRYFGLGEIELQAWVSSGVKVAEYTEKYWT